MGKCICEKHGHTGIVEVCPHAGDLIASGRYGDFHLIDMLGLLLVCEDCWHRYDLRQFENCEGDFETFDDKVLDAFYAVYERLEGRRVEWPDPFPVYERSLTANHRDALDRLEAHLIRNFDFKPSIVEHYKKEQAIFVQGGNYRRPLTVAVYYVTAADEQERIASLAADFLAAFELNQSQLQFFEAEVWITWSNPEKRISGGYPGQETLLREIFLNC